MWKPYDASNRVFLSGQSQMYRSTKHKKINRSMRNEATVKHVDYNSPTEADARMDSNHSSIHNAEVTLNLSRIVEEHIRASIEAYGITELRPPSKYTSTSSKFAKLSAGNGKASSSSFTVNRNFKTFSEVACLASVTRTSGVSASALVDDLRRSSLISPSHEATLAKSSSFSCSLRSSSTLSGSPLVVSDLK